MNGMVLGSGVIHRPVTNSALVLSGGSSGSLGANLEMFGETAGSTAVFDTDAVLFRTTAGVENARINSTGIAFPSSALLAPNATTRTNGMFMYNGTIYRTVANGALVLSGGSSDSLGANLEMFGESAGSTAVFDTSAVLFRTTAGAEHARIFSEGFTVPEQASAPTALRDGQLYYNTATSKLQLRAAGVWVDLN